MLLTRMMANLNGLLRNYGTIQNSKELLAKPVTVLDKQDAQELVVPQGSINFENIRFHYDSARSVINDLSLSDSTG